jgi:hypothetical protein
MKAVTGYFDTLFAKEIYTDKVCVKKSDGTSACFDGDQVEHMLNSSPLQLLTPSQGGTVTTPSPLVPIDTGSSTATTTAPEASSTPGDSSSTSPTPSGIENAPTLVPGGNTSGQNEATSTQ